MNKVVKNEGGRPTKLDEDTVKKLESIFKVGGTVEQACAYAGITRQSYYNYIKADEGFLTKMDNARFYSDIVAKNLVVDSIIKDKNLDSAKWWLEKREFNKPVNDIKVLNAGGEMNLEFIGKNE